MGNSPAEQGIRAARLDNEVRSKTMHLIIDAAQKKFGEVIECNLHSPIDATYKLLIKRDSHPFPDRPYMTITGGVSSTGQCGFFWGHYDLALEKAQQVMADYRKGVI